MVNEYNCCTYVQHIINMHITNTCNLKVHIGCCSTTTTKIDKFRASHNQHQLTAQQSNLISKKNCVDRNNLLERDRKPWFVGISLQNRSVLELSKMHPLWRVLRILMIELWQIGERKHCSTRYFLEYGRWMKLGKCVEELKIVVKSGAVCI